MSAILANFDLIEGFFREKFVDYVTVVGCFNILATGVILKNLGHHRLVTVMNIDTPHNFSGLRTEFYHMGVVFDVSQQCRGSEEFLIESGELRLFDDKHHWLMFGSPQEVADYFRGVELNIDCDLHVPVLRTNRTWEIMDFYNLASRHGGVFRFDPIGFYDTTQGYNISSKPKEDGKYRTRGNLTGITFKTEVVLPVPFEGTLNDYLNSDLDREINTFNRFHCRLIFYTQTYYNFSMIIAVGNSWGYTTPNGSFDGMVGSLESRSIDFGCSPLFFRYDRGQVIDYGRNTWTLRAAFIFRTPKSKSSLEIFLRPLSTTIWVITGFFCVLCVVILRIVNTFERTKYNRGEIEVSWSSSVIFTVGALFQQGSHSTPSITCGRITTMTIFLLAVIIYQFYGASLVSSLLMRPSDVVRSLRDLLESNLRVGCEDILYDRDYFEHTTDRVALELLNTKILNPKRNMSNFLTPEEGLTLVQNGGYAFHVELDTAYPIIKSTFHDEKTLCELREINLFPTQPMHANYQKRSPFRDLFDTCFQRFAENGVLDRERRFWHVRKPACIRDSQTFNVGLNEFYPALVMLLVGMLVSLIMLGLEIKFKPHKKEELVYPFVN